jgi:hypothetical protein
MHSYVPNLWLRLLYFTWWLCSLRQWCEEYNNVHKPLLWDLALFLTNQSGGGQILSRGKIFILQLSSSSCKEAKLQNKGPLHQTTSSPVSLYSWINIKGALQNCSTKLLLLACTTSIEKTFVLAALFEFSLAVLLWTINMK